MPGGCREIRWSVYDNAVSMKEFLDTHEHYDELTIPRLPADLNYDFLYVTGHGFNDFENDGHSASPQAVAVFSEKYPMDEPAKFKWKVFNNPAGLVPLVCDKSNSSWAFCVGYEGQSYEDSDRSPSATP